MTWFGRPKKRDRREEYINDVVETWDAVPARDKPGLIIKQPDLYFAVSRLAAHETVRKEMKRR